MILRSNIITKYNLNLMFHLNILQFTNLYIRLLAITLLIYFILIHV